MQNSQKFRQIIAPFILRIFALPGGRAFKLFSVSILLFIASPNYAIAYGGHGHGSHYGSSYGHYGYYGHHGYGIHYSHHGHIGTAGYVFLGILGVAVLSHILNNDNYGDRHYRKPYSYNQPTYRQSRPYKTPAHSERVSTNNKSRAKPVYSYSNNEGWDWLAKGHADYALDIFAIQSQQNLNSGIPRVGFAIAAATNGEMNRATRAMRKAIRVDADALDKINIINIKLTIETLTENYQSISNNNINNTDNAFMVSVFSYLQQDYSAANKLIAGNDQSQSANNLRKLIMEKEGISLH